jgi:hypothetical protein
MIVFFHKLQDMPEHNFFSHPASERLSACKVCDKEKWDHDDKLENLAGSELFILF